MEAGLRLGLGKQEQEDFYVAPENVQRKKLEVELQAEEDEDRLLRREVQPYNLLAAAWCKDNLLAYSLLRFVTSYHFKDNTSPILRWEIYK